MGRRSTRRRRRTRGRPRLLRRRRELAAAGALIALLTWVSLQLLPSKPDVRASVGYWASVYGVDPRLARAVAWNESGFNPSAVSATGAQGVMQVQPATWQFVERDLLHRSVAHDPEGGIQVGVAYLRYLLGRFHGDRSLALAAYYQGPAGLQRHGPYPSTRHYVATVLALTQRF